METATMMFENSFMAQPPPMEKRQGPSSPAPWPPPQPPSQHAYHRNGAGNGTGFDSGSRDGGSSRDGGTTHLAPQVVSSTVDSVFTEQLRANERVYSARPDSRGASSRGRVGVPASPMGPPRWAPNGAVAGAEDVASAEFGGGRASQRLRELLESVTTAEFQNDILQEQNHRYRIRCLQHMREKSVQGLMRVAFNCWVAARADAQTRHELERVRAYYIQKFSPLLSRWFGCSTKAMLTNIIARWRCALDALRDENRLFAELEAHRGGRSQLIQQYRELEAEFLQERRRLREAEVQIEDYSTSLDSVKHELAWATGSLEAQGREVDEMRSKTRALDDQLRESQDRSADLKRELRAQTERARRLEHQIETEAVEKEELHENMLRAERIAEGLRAEASRRESDSARHQAVVQDKDAVIEAMEAQLREMRGVISSSIESLSRSKSFEAKVAENTAVPKSSMGPLHGPGSQISPEMSRIDSFAATRRIEEMMHFPKEYAKDLQFAKEKLQFTY